MGWRTLWKEITADIPKLEDLWTPPKSVNPFCDWSTLSSKSALRWKWTSSKYPMWNRSIIQGKSNATSLAKKASHSDISLIPWRKKERFHDPRDLAGNLLLQGRRWNKIVEQWRLLCIRYWWYYYSCFDFCIRFQIRIDLFLTSASIEPNRQITNLHSVMYFTWLDVSVWNREKLFRCFTRQVSLQPRLTLEQQPIIVSPDIKTAESISSHAVTRPNLWTMVWRHSFSLHLWWTIPVSLHPDDDIQTMSVMLRCSCDEFCFWFFQTWTQLLWNCTIS